MMRAGKIVGWTVVPGIHYSRPPVCQQQTTKLWKKRTGLAENKYKIFTIFSVVLAKQNKIEP
jgi:hypothetical protein